MMAVEGGVRVPIRFKLDTYSALSQSWSACHVLCVVRADHYTGTNEPAPAPYVYTPLDNEVTRINAQVRVH